MRLHTLCLMLLCAALPAAAGAQTPPPPPAARVAPTPRPAPAPMAPLEALAVAMAAEARTFASEVRVSAARAMAHEAAALAHAQDPADSLYRVARETLNRYEYRRAADLFRQLRERHPRSAYAADAAYWQAFALYRVGATDDLRAALRVLDQQGSFAARDRQADAQALRARIQGALARRGDESARQAVAQAARNGAPTCDTEDIDVRVEALNTLSQMDQATATPLLRKVIARRDDCSARLRQAAVMLLARRGEGAALGLLGEVAAQDPSSSVRSVAFSHINQVTSDEATAVLENLLRADDEKVRRAAAATLVRRSGARARRAIRGYLESPQTTESHKVELIHHFQRESATAEDVQYLRALYEKTDSDRIRSAILSIVPRIAPEEGRAWLAGIARDPNAPAPARSTAISYLGRDGALTVAELVRMFDAASERRIRQQVASALGRRNESEATDKLIDIVKTTTDPEVRRTAIGALRDKKDPRLQALLQELIER